MSPGVAAWILATLLAQPQQPPPLQVRQLVSISKAMILAPVTELAVR